MKKESITRKTKWTITEHESAIIYDPSIKKHEKERNKKAKKTSGSHRLQ